MIKITEGELLDMLPSSLKNDTDMICLSYALKAAINNMIEYELGSMTQNFIDYVPEAILDVLAVELRSLYYLDSMDIETKRTIIKNTLIWHTKAGTPAAVAEMMQAVFGVGEVSEWWDLESEAGTFSVTTSAVLSDTSLEYMDSILNRIKNIRSHLLNVTTQQPIEAAENVAMAAYATPHIVIGG